MVMTVDKVQVAVEPARGRQTAQNDFASLLRRGAGRAVQAVANTTRAVAEFVPGGSFVSAVANVVESAADAISGPAGTSGMSLLQAQERLQQEGFQNSLRLLELQRRMQQESEAFGAASNLMKSRHETAKNVINNLR